MSYSLVLILQRIYELLHPANLMIDTGVAVEIPRGWFGLVVPRSSLGKRHLMIANTAGVIDSDYRGTIKMNLYNYGSANSREFRKTLSVGSATHYSTHNFKIVELEETIRGEGGFGSSANNFTDPNIVGTDTSTPTYQTKTIEPETLY